MGRKLLLINKGVLCLGFLVRSVMIDDSLESLLRHVVMVVMVFMLFL